MFLYFLTQRQLSPEPGSGGYSLDDLDNDDDLDKDKNEGKTDEEIKAEKDAEEAEQKKLDEEQAKDDKILADKEAAKELEKEEAAKKDANKDKTDTPEEDEEDFWDEVDKLRGETLDVDYGDVDPVSPEGAIIRENALIDSEINKYDAYLEETQPRAYAYLKHKMEGGTDEEFFKLSAGTEDLPTPEQLENDIELQKQMVTRNMKAKGNSDKVITSVIKGLITDDELEETAKEALTEEQTASKEKIEYIKAEADRKTAEKQSAIGKMVKYVNDVVNTGVIDNITIPEKDRRGFVEHFNKNVRYENGKFLLVTELSDDNVIQNFKKEFFNFKGGKIEELITKQARTENAKRLVKTIGNDKRVRTTSDNNDSGFVALGDL